MGDRFRRNVHRHDLRGAAEFGRPVARSAAGIENPRAACGKARCEAIAGEVFIEEIGIDEPRNDALAGELMSGNFGLQRLRWAQHAEANRNSTLHGIWM